MTSDTDPVERYLKPLIARCPDAPTLDRLSVDDFGTLRGTAAIARAALAWHLDGQPEAIAARIRRELDESDRLVVERMFRAHVDADRAVKPAVGAVLSDIPRPGQSAERWLRWYEANAERVARRHAARRRAVVAA